MSGLERDQAVLAGSADIDLAGTGVMPATTARLREEDSPLLERADELSSGSVRMLALPTDVAPMDNPACRTAVAAAIDRRAVQELLSQQGDAVPTSRLWPEALPGGPEESDPRADPAAARAALIECGQPDGFSTVLAVPNAPTSVQVADLVADQLAEVGIQATVTPFEAGKFYTDYVGNPDNVAGQGFGIILATWTADFPTPGSFLVRLVDGRLISTVANTNYARLNDETVNALIDQARATRDPAAWRDAAVAAQGTGAYMPLVESRVHLVAGQRLRNGVVMRPYLGYDLATAGVR
jgi:peptide/nickel transport system substrate-binding protein